LVIHNGLNQNFGEHEFKKLVDALIERKLEKHKNLWEESNYFWGEIDGGTLTFNRPRVEAALPQVNKETLLTFFKNHIQRGSKWIIKID
jgi:insulysin